MAYEDIQAFWITFAEAFAHPLTSNRLLGNFVSNPNVTGAYAEAWIRWVTTLMLPTFRVSTGTVIRSSDYNTDLREIPQCDIIIWDPTELPALFEREHFALVHTQSVRAIIEVKRQLKSIEKTRTQLSKQQRRLLSEYRRNVLCVVTAHSDSLFQAELVPNWLKEKNSQDPPEITRLLDSGTGEPDADGIFALIYFLSHIAREKPPATFP